jgi:isopenicillin N synthase-like dioxygenase
MPPNVHVCEVANFDRATYRLYEALDVLWLRVLSGIAFYLGLPQDYFVDKVVDGNSILRLLHYPPLKSGATGVRAGAHEDINVITLLLGAEEAGLQLLDRDGNWHDIAPPPGCVVVNIGDMLQRLTNHVLPSTTHRVVNPKPERASFSRYSMPFFQHFAPDFLIETLPGCVTPQRPNRYPVPITADAYLKERLAEIKLA